MTTWPALILGIALARPATSATAGGINIRVRPYRANARSAAPLEFPGSRTAEAHTATPR